MWYAIEFVFMLVFVAIAWRDGYYKCLLDQKKDRERIKLESTKDNITNRLAKAIEEGLPSNKQWGFRFLFDRDEEEGVNYICVRDTGADSLPVILYLNIYTTTSRGVYVLTKMQGRFERIIWTKNPNDPELTLLIGHILDDLQAWSPEKQTV